MDRSPTANFHLPRIWTYLQARFPFRIPLASTWCLEMTVKVKASVTSGDGTSMLEIWRRPSSIMKILDYMGEWISQILSLDSRLIDRAHDLTFVSQSVEIVVMSTSHDTCSKRKYEYLISFRKNIAICSRWLTIYLHSGLLPATWRNYNYWLMLRTLTVPNWVRTTT